jgi:hypothetical protein
MHNLFPQASKEKAAKLGLLLVPIRAFQRGKINI